MKPLFIDKGLRLYQGGATEVLKERKADSIDCVVTSPPYWQMKDYGHADQLGLEPTPEEYAVALADVFEQVKRVLKTSGTCWINVGDKYKDGELVPASWLFALEMRTRGWKLLNDNIWHKTNATPYGAPRRPTRDHEYLFVFARSVEDYYYDKRAVMVPAAWERWGKQTIKKDYRGIKPIDMSTLEDRRKEGKPVRTVWSMPTKPYPGAHMAPYPPAFAARCIQIGSPENALVLDPFMGSGATAAACKLTGRRCIGIDLVGDYLGQALERYRSGE